MAILRYALLRYASLRYCYLHYGCLCFGYLHYAFLRYGFFRDGHMQNGLVAIQFWIDAFMIWTILFQILIIEFCHRYTSIGLSSEGTSVCTAFNPFTSNSATCRFYCLTPDDFTV